MGTTRAPQPSSIRESPAPVQTVEISTNTTPLPQNSEILTQPSAGSGVFPGPPPNNPGNNGGSNEPSPTPFVQAGYDGAPVTNFIPVLQPVAYNSYQEGENFLPPVQPISDGSDSIGTIQLIEPPPQIPEGGTLQIEVDPPLPPEIANSPLLVSNVFDVNLYSDSNELVEFQGVAQLCFTTNYTIEHGKSCMGYLDETVYPPKWKCEDYCLEESSSSNSTQQVCGETSHFTNFAILLGGDGESGGGCDDSSNFILGSGTNDLILILSTVGFLWALLIVGAIFLLATPMGRRVYYGKEGYRVYHVRAVRSKVLSSVSGDSGDNDPSV